MRRIANTLIAALISLAWVLFLGTSSVVSGAPCPAGSTDPAPVLVHPVAGMTLCEVMYKWTDSQGGVHFTNSADDIPERYRGGASMFSMPDYPEKAPPQTPEASDTSEPVKAEQPASTNESDKKPDGLSREEEEAAAAAPAVEQAIMPHGR